MKDKEALNGSAESSGGSTAPDGHPARSLRPRAKGYGIGGAYEKPYRERRNPVHDRRTSYGPIPHSGYYGAGAGDERFERGNAGFNDELPWYRAQYGENTGGTTKEHT